MIQVLLAVLWWLAVASPILLTAGAFLDAARRPEWAWAMAQRRRVMWLTALVAGGVTLVAGPIVAVVYFAVARPDVAAAEKGDFSRLKNL